MQTKRKRPYFICNMFVVFARWRHKSAVAIHLPLVTGQSLLYTITWLCSESGMKKQVLLLIFATLLKGKDMQKQFA